jgi:uncharacterized FlgJ-related protein
MNDLNIEKHKQLTFLLTIIILISSCGVSRRQTTHLSQSRVDYIKEFKNLAIKEMKRSGVPASITLAQGMLESDNGNSYLARKANNHFGIKCHDWKGPSVRFDDDKKNECFRKYRSVYESYKDHSDFLTDNIRYRFLFDLDPTDYKRWARGLKKAGYATKRDYAELLIRIIENNKLYEFDRGKRSYTGRTQVAKADPVKKAPTLNGSFKINVGHKIYTRNRIKYIIAQNGDTYQSITKELEMMPWELSKYNEIKKGSDLAIGQILYIQPKRKKAETGHNYHIVKQNDTMYGISQKYGIKLKHLYKMNRMKKDEEPERGQKIWLRDKKPASE